MTVLLTGGTGFFGKAVSRTLHAEHREVRCIIREGTSERLDKAMAQSEVLETPDLFANTADWWARACDGIDLVIHSAWYAEPGQYLTSERNIDCLTGTLALATGARDAGVRRFVGIGTCFEYDMSGGYLSTQTPLAPETVYAASKASAYMTLSNYLPPAGVEFVWARLFYLYGPGENPKRLVPYLHQQLSAGKVADLSQGRQIRDYMDVDDAARLLVSDAYATKQGAVNICSTVERTVADIAMEIADQYGRRDLLNFGARQDNLSDPPVVVGIR